jgi:hypothetical protein
MAMSSMIDSPINDATAGTSAHALGSAPAVALGHLYQVTAHAMGVAVENAVSAQQQMNTLAQAATNQALMQLYLMNTTSAAASPEGDKAFGAPQVLAATAGPEAVADAIRQAIESASRLELDEAGPWAHAAKELMSMVASALWEFQKIGLDTGMFAVKQAATVAVLIRMIQAPDQLEQFQKILAVIKEL